MRNFDGGPFQQVRTDAYQRALEGNPSLIKGASVLDVGCGTGILSMFAARGGAAQVIGKRLCHLCLTCLPDNLRYGAHGQLVQQLVQWWHPTWLFTAQEAHSGTEVCAAAVEGSKCMAQHAHSIVAENRLDSGSGGPITVVFARMEDVASLPVAQVLWGFFSFLSYL